MGMTGPKPKTRSMQKILNYESYSIIEFEVVSWTSFVKVYGNYDGNHRALSLDF